MITLTKRLKKEAESRNNSGSTQVKHEHPAPKRISIRDKLLIKEVCTAATSILSLFINGFLCHYICLGSRNGTDHSFHMPSEV